MNLAVRYEMQWPLGPRGVTGPLRTCICYGQKPCPGSRVCTRELWEGFDRKKPPGRPHAARIAIARVISNVGVRWHRTFVTGPISVGQGVPEFLWFSSLFLRCLVVFLSGFRTVSGSAVLLGAFWAQGLPILTSFDFVIWHALSCSRMRRRRSP